MKKVFIGYSLEDGSYLNALKKYLKPLELEELIQVCEGFISEELVDPNLEKELKNADILIFLFSTDILSQKFIWRQEMKHILEKAKNGDIQFIPVIIRDCLLEDTPFDLHRETNPISNLLNNEEGWMKVIKEIRKATFEYQQKNQNPSNFNTEANTMTIEQLKTKVRELIAKAKPQEAINEIKKWALENNDRPLLDETVLVEGTFAKLEKEVRQGTVYPQDAGIRQSQINSRILDLPNQASTPTPEDVTPPEVKPKTGINGKLKILMLTANPAGSYQLELEKEHSRITTKLQEKTEQFALIVHHAVNNTEFKELNETAKPNILHFSGHGDSNGIMLQNDDKNGSKLLTANALDALFEYFVDEGILFKAVVLNACYSEDQAKAIANHVPYVIASTTEISDEAAIAFSVGFYFKLDAQGGNIEQSFRSGRTQAVTTGAEKSYFALYKDGAKIEA